MQLPRNDPQRAQIQNRTLDNIQKDHDQFVADGSCTSRQRLYHNVLHEKLLDIELDKVTMLFIVVNMHTQILSMLH